MKPGSRKGRSILLARKAEEQERVREIHSALGGSAEAFDRAAEQPPDEEVSLGSRIDAYIQLQTARRAAGVEAPAPDVEAPAPVLEPPVAVEPPAPLVEPPPPVVEAPLPVVEPPAEFVAAPPAPRVRRRAASTPVHAVLRLVRLVAHACLATARRLAGVAALLVRAVRRVLRALVPAGRAVLRVGPRVVAAIGRSVRAVGRRARSSRRAATRIRSARSDRRESDRLSPTVLERVQGYTPPVTGDVPAVPEPAAPPPPPAAPREEPLEAQRVRRPRVKPRALLVGAALAGAAVAAVLVVDRGHGSGSGSTAAQAAAVRAMADASGSRTSFSSPIAYAAAMTRLALANGRTQVGGEPSCNTSSTWKSWSCDARGRPSIGPFAGRWVTYRCTPSYTPQPGAPATLVVNCRPRTPPPSSTS